MRVAGFISLLAVLLARVEAAPKALKPHERHTQHHTSTAVSHQTKLGQSAHKGPVPTVTVERSKTIFRTVTVSTTVHSTTTKKLKPMTVTDTAFTTSTAYVTASANTDVVTDTWTEFDTATVTVTPAPISVTVGSDTTTTTTTTSTIATADGFIPIVSSLPTALPMQEQRRGLEKRSNAVSIKDMRHPQSVTCIKEVIVEIIIIEIFIGAPITKTVCAPRVTTHKTSAVTTTSTIIPADVLTTDCEIVTCTITSATTLPPTTQTVTTPVIVTESSTTSAFAACATNNIAGAPLSPDFGDLTSLYIDGLSWLPGTTLTNNGATTPYDCCASCIQDDSCAFSYFEIQGSSCLLLDTTTCSQSNTFGWADLTPLGEFTAAASNGNCGAVYHVPVEY
ncbi:uncharacterized protein PFLUO_LOCUS8288 [Penicillium psychrofluorescens]|uniref:uncharacterized protein n=1 Tax=Penicillium psychrofluorescens TaxID=3158075 RepID=UPI003CCD009A